MEKGLRNVSKQVTETTLGKEAPHESLPAPVRDRRELAHRVSGQIEVTLYWSAHDNSTSVEICQTASEETFLFDVMPERALDAYYHPFSHFPIPFDDLVPVDA
jgi:hypothetical protein